MSYYIMRSCGINKKTGRITMSVADSSLRPLYFFKTEYGTEITDFKEKLEEFFRSMMHGNIQPYKGVGVASILSDCKQLYNRAQGKHNLWDLDFTYKTKLDKELSGKIINLYAIPKILGESPDYVLLNSFLKDFPDYIADVIEKKKKADEEAGIVRILASSISDVFPGYDILFKEDDNECVLAPTELYTSGILRKDDRCVFFGPDSEFMFQFLAGKGYPYAVPQEIADSVDELLKKVPMEPAVKPYKEVA